MPESLILIRLADDENERTPYLRKRSSKNVQGHPDQYQNDIRETTIMAPFTFWITAVVPFGLFLLGFQFIRRGVRALLGLQLAVDPNLEEEG